MSSEHLKIGTIKVVTDNDDGMSRIGDIDGGFQEHLLEDFFKAHGEKGYRDICEHLIYMGATARRVWHSAREESRVAEARPDQQARGLVSAGRSHPGQ